MDAFPADRLALFTEPRGRWLIPNLIGVFLIFLALVFSPQPEEPFQVCERFDAAWNQQDKAGMKKCATPNMGHLISVLVESKRDPGDSFELLDECRMPDDRNQHLVGFRWICMIQGKREVWAGVFVLEQRPRKENWEIEDLIITEIGFEKLTREPWVWLSARSLDLQQVLKREKEPAKLASTQQKQSGTSGGQMVAAAGILTAAGEGAAKQAGGSLFKWLIASTSLKALSVFVVGIPALIAGFWRKLTSSTPSTSASTLTALPDQAAPETVP
jgi:hypothetical protein